jgi:GNAT superfamily N-acetyltransferase
VPEVIRLCASADLGVIEAIVNEAAERYHGAIPADCWHEPYMSSEELETQVAAGVHFWGFEQAGILVGVMGMQRSGDATLIRHAYVRKRAQGQGVGTALLRALTARAQRPLLVGTWAAATWAIAFYERNGFVRTPPDRMDDLLRRYWNIPPRQREASVVLEWAGQLS